ncbi:MAG: DUF2171 domain-containing protein [Sphingobium sp.]|nr:DUF2171 domain-containing protein [Sphingobium sp.]
MFEKWRIKEHMEVADSTGRHIGTVDEVEDNRIKLTRSDSTDGSHHYLDWESVDRIENNRVYLKAGTALPTGFQSEMAGTAGSSAANLTGSQGAAKLPNEDNVLFGTSGHGTGMGGSGTS